jgi:hypothetical protein
MDMKLLEKLLDTVINEANKKKNAVLFIMDQLSNDESSSDAELILHLAKETGNSVANMSKLVKAERNNFLNNIMPQDKGIKIIKKYIKTGW